MSKKCIHNWHCRCIFYFFFSIQFFIILFPRYLPNYSFYNCSIPAVPLLRYSKYLLNYSIYNQVSRYLIWFTSDVSLHILWNPILCGIYVQYVCWIIVPILTFTLVLLDALNIYSFNKERLIVIEVGLLVILLPFFNEITLKNLSVKRSNSKNENDD